MVGGAVILMGIAIAGVLMFQNKHSPENTSKQEEPVVKVAFNPARQEFTAPSPARQETPPPAKNELSEKPPPNPEPRREAPEPPPPADSNQAIPADLLDHLKSATVFVKVEGSQIKGSGSGFLIDVKGDTAFVITNAHVIDPKIEIEVHVSPRQAGPGMGMGPPGMQGMPGAPRMGPNFGRQGFPRGPMGPMGPMGGPRGSMAQRMAPGQRMGPAQPSGEEETFKVVVPIGNETIPSVFWRGTKKEQSYRAQVVASDRKRDLAILKLTGFKDLSNPIGMARSVNLRETMPVYVLGFPFGKNLATNKGNPAITIGKGSVSSIRRDERDEVALVQIDGALNPGNSGGPVVDTQGRLVGVAVATINPELGSGIGFAIPTSKLTALLEGKRDNLENSPAPGRKSQGGDANPPETPGRNSSVSRVEKIFDKQPRVFLSDLEEFDVKSGPWEVTKNGQLGDPENRPVQVNGVSSPKAISMHPPDGDYASANFRLDKQASLFKADVALNDSTTLVIDAAVFEVWGDGKRLWQSKPIHDSRRPQKSKVNVSKVDVLELRVYSTGSHFGLHAVWVEPRLLQKPDTPDKN
jgi:S1-C subfamily serine protease